MNSNTTTFSDPQDFVAPRWQEPVVLVSMAAVAAAVGFGVLFEAGAAPWLSTATALSTAAVLFGVHRGVRPQPRDGVEDGLGIARAPTRRSTPDRAAAASSSAATPAATMPSAPTPPVDQQARPAPAAPDLAQFVPRQSVTLPTMTVSSPFVSDVPHRAFKQPELVQTPSKQPTQPDLKFEQLEALIREMAAGVPGPKAMSPDPDRPARPHLSAPTTADAWSLQTPATSTPASPVGFGAQVVGHAGHRVAEAVAAERIDVLLTPIQSLIEQRASHFEVSVRLRDEDGTVLSNDEVSRTARNTGLAGTLDALKLSRVARVARRVQARGGAPADVLADVFGPSLADNAFIAATGATLAGQSAGQAQVPIVLALAQSDVRTFGRVHWSALATLGDFGLRFAISDVTDLDMDFELMAARGFVFAKLDAGVFLDGLPLGTVVIPATDVARHLSGCGLTVIVGRIDDEQRLDQIAACGVSLGQGALFGEAKPVRQDILTA